MTTTTQALATQDRSTVNLVPQYRAEFAEVLPAHVKAETFVRLAQAALRKNADLRKAADNDPGSLIFALREAARLGHEPGTEAFYLVPIGGRVEGWEGYRGVVERMYRAGAVLSVVAEIVRQNDKFTWIPGTMERPEHIVDWFGADRGPILGAYSYALLQGGATSKVVVIGQPYIEKVKRESRGSNSPTSPWKKWEEAMVLKTVIHRLEPFVPTSAEYMRERLRVAAEVVSDAPVVVVAPALVEDAPAAAPSPDFDPETGEVYEAELVPDGAA